MFDLLKGNLRLAKWGSEAEPMCFQVWIPSCIAYGLVDTMAPFYGVMAPKGNLGGSWIAGTVATKTTGFVVCHLALEKWEGLCQFAGWTSMCWECAGNQTLLQNPKCIDIYRCFPQLNLKLSI